MLQSVEHDRAAAGLVSPAPAESLESQLEAGIRTPPVGRVARTALLTLSLTLIPFVGWGTMTTMERAVLAGGQLAPEGRRKTVNLLEAGILRHVTRAHGGCAGVYAAVLVEGVARRGDPIQLM